MNPTDPPLESRLDLHRLSPAERRVLDEALAGRSAREIAQTLVLSEATVRSHLSRIYGKLDVRGHVELVARASGPAVPATAPATPSVERRPSSAPIIVLIVGLAILSLVVPLAAIVVGPALLIAGWLVGRAVDGSLLRASRPWLIVAGAIISVWAVVVVMVVLGLMAAGGGAEVN